MADVMAEDYYEDEYQYNDSITSEVAYPTTEGKRTFLQERNTHSKRDW